MRTMVDEGFIYTVYYHRAGGCYEIVRTWDGVSVLLQGDDAAEFSFAFDEEYEDTEPVYLDYDEEAEDYDRHKDYVDMICGDYDLVMEAECVRLAA